MRYFLKVSSLAICAMSLTGCAFTQGVAQNVYDERAEKDCRPTAGGDDSIHKTARSNCAGGFYEPKPKAKPFDPARE